MTLFEKYKNKLISDFLELKEQSKNISSLFEIEKNKEEINKIKKLFEDISDGQNILSYLTEENINNKNNSESKKSLKSGDEKINTLNSFDGENEGVKYEYSDEENNIHNQYEIKNGMEMIEYDLEPSEKFKERMENSIKGSPVTGNSGFSGNPEDFEKDHENFSNNFIKTTKASKQKRDDSKIGIVSMGDDIETTNKKVNSRPIGLNENKKDSKLENKMSKIKRLIFERTFSNKNDVIGRIPDYLKEDNKVFMLTDKNETYKIRWEGTLEEGEAVVIGYENKTLLSEEFSKMEELMTYSPKTANTVKKTSKDDADKVLFEMMNIFKEKTILSENLNESDDIESNGSDSIDESDIDEAAFGDMFRSYDKIFMRDNKSDIDAIKSMPESEEKNAKAKELLSKANAFIKEKGIETGSATSLKNEIKRAMGYNVSLRGGQS